MHFPILNVENGTKQSSSSWKTHFTPQTLTKTNVHNWNLSYFLCNNNTNSQWSSESKPYHLWRPADLWPPYFSICIVWDWRCLETQRDGSSLHGWYMLHWVSKVRPEGKRFIPLHISRCLFFPWKSIYDPCALFRNSGVLLSRRESSRNQKLFCGRDWWSKKLGERALRAGEMVRRKCICFSRGNKVNFV